MSCCSVCGADEIDAMSIGVCAIAIGASIMGGGICGVVGRGCAVSGRTNAGADGIGASGGALAVDASLVLGKSLLVNASSAASLSCGVAMLDGVCK